MNPQWRGQFAFRTVYFISNVYASGEERIRIKKKRDNVNELLEAKYFTVFTISTISPWSMYDEPTISESNAVMFSF